MSYLEGYEFQGPGGTQMHDAAIEAGLVERPVREDNGDRVQIFRTTSKGKDKRDNDEDERRRRRLDRRTLDQLGRDADGRTAEDENGEEDEDEDEDDDDDDDDDFMAEYRRQRVEQLKQESEAQRRLANADHQIPSIDASSFTKSVIAASRHQHVILVLYTQPSSACDLLLRCMGSLAARHSSLHVVKLRVEHDGHIANFPMHHAPAVLVYHREEKIKQWSTIDAWAGMATTPEVVEWEFAELGLITTELEEDPRVQRIRERLGGGNARTKGSSSGTGSNRRSNRSLDDDSDDSDRGS